MWLVEQRHLPALSFESDSIAYFETRYVWPLPEQYKNPFDRVEQTPRKLEVPPLGGCAVIAKRKSHALS